MKKKIAFFILRAIFLKFLTVFKDRSIVIDIQYIYDNLRAREKAGKKQGGKKIITYRS